MWISVAVFIFKNIILRAPNISSTTFNSTLKTVHNLGIVFNPVENLNSIFEKKL